MKFAIGVVLTLIALTFGVWIAAYALKGIVGDCEKLGQFRFGEKVYQCKQIKAWEGME